MTIQITHLVVKDTPPPDEGPVLAGHLYGIAPVFKTIVPDYAPNKVEDEDEEEEVEAKVVKRGRRPGRPKVNESAEVK